MLEVIAASVQDAIEAEAGGADRLELVSSPELEGLTPPLPLLQSVLSATKLPVRVMLRDRPTMSAGTAAELAALERAAAEFSRLPINGLVAGFLVDGCIDNAGLRAICQAAPETPITFHRAFDEVTDQACALCELKQFPNVDRILTGGTGSSLQERLASALRFQDLAAPAIKILFAAGLEASDLDLDVLCASGIEIHVGRAARPSRNITGPVSRDCVSSLKRALISRGTPSHCCPEKSSKRT